MKNKLLISTLRKIWSTKKKFLSLLCLSLLGVGFFAGIKATSPDMQKTLDTYLDEAHFYDIEIQSTMGLTEEDIQEIQKLDIANDVIGNRYVDEIIEVENNENVVRFISLNNINEVSIVEGKFPTKKNEVVVENSFLEDNKLKINDTLTVENEKLSETTFTIVGIVESPLYFTGYRGTTTVGNGQWNYYFYVQPDAFSFDYYTSIYVVLKDTEKKLTNSSSYVKKVEVGKNALKEIQEKRETARYEELYHDTITKLESMGAEINEADFVKPTWYLFDRKNNQAYTTFIDATKSIAQIGSVFPLVFFVVAILISLISMSRMVEEERLDIGTLKGLGFSDIHIYVKNLCYAFLATTLGGFIGTMIGFWLIPTVIWDIYTAMFQIPIFVNEFNIPYALIGYLISIFCICGATFITTFLILKEKPSDLMRPKAPKLGKKIFLEQFCFWTKLPFSMKISIRNIFRYKKRIFVTIIGIAGSTALMLVGFGLKDSVTDVVDFHYNEVFVYDQMIYLKNDENLNSFMDLLASNSEITSTVEGHYELIKAYNEEESLDVNLIVPKESLELESVIQLNDGEKVLLSEDKIVISEKMSRLLKVKVGDVISFLVDDEYKQIQVSNIVKNYVQHYVYMTKDTYEKIFGSYNTNVVFVKNSTDYNKDFDYEIVKNEIVSNLITKEVSSNMVYDILESLNSVVMILIVSSAMLAFVILYNLSSINISERKREISTLKVLGFYDEEVDAYITNENYFITIIGIALGLFGGLYLCHYVISTCEPEYIMFVRHIKLFSYVISTIISILFTIIVSRITHFNLKKIDMVESLKSNE